MTINVRQVARILSQVENHEPESDALLRNAYGAERHIPVIGVTGPPGAGKSTLLDHLALHWAEGGERVAVIAVDPSSPYTGGAVLGDRFRMDRASAHPNVFVRSLSSRGQVGGLSRAVQDVVTALGALDFHRVIVETVGSGQSDVDVGELADCVLVLSVPGLGDQIQAGKAGILEIGDAYVVNKSDAPGADTVIGHLRANLDLIYPGREGVNSASVPEGHGFLPANGELHARHGTAGIDRSFWRPPVLRVSARNGSGITELAQACDAFLRWQRHSGREEGRYLRRLRQHILHLAAAQLMQVALVGEPQARLQELVSALRDGRSTPDDAARTLLSRLSESFLLRR